MNSRISNLSTGWQIGYTIFLVSIICYQISLNAGSDEPILSMTRKKIIRVYRCACEETRTAYEEVKKHKKLIMGIITYLVFEGFGYSEGWDTPLRRLFMPKKSLDDALREYQKLRVRYEALEKQYEVLDKQLQDKILEDLKKHQEALMKQFEKFLGDEQ